MTGNRESVDRFDQDGGDTAKNDAEYTAGEPASEQVNQDPPDCPNYDPLLHDATGDEMVSDDLRRAIPAYKGKEFRENGKERKSGRVCIIKWLYEKGITSYVALSITPVEATPIIARPTACPTGAISHPEAILRRSDPIE